MFRLAAGVEAPEPVQLRRFNIGPVIRITLPALAVVILISALVGFDLARSVTAS